MKSITFASVAAGFLGMASVSQAVVDVCRGLAYANGGIYTRIDDSGLLSDLGDFPVDGPSFELALEWQTDGNLYLLQHTDARQYVRFHDHAYIDLSPGANAPVRFTADNSTLAPGEQSWAWSNLMGFFYFTPNGELNGPDGQLHRQGFEFVDVPGHHGVKQLYWNDELREEHGYGVWWPTRCLVDMQAEVTQGDRP